MAKKEEKFGHDVEDIIEFCITKPQDNSKGLTERIEANQQNVTNEADTLSYGSEKDEEIAQVDEVAEYMDPSEDIHYYVLHEFKQII